MLTPVKSIVKYFTSVSLSFEIVDEVELVVSVVLVVIEVVEVVVEVVVVVVVVVIVLVVEVVVVEVFVVVVVASVVVVVVDVVGCTVVDLTPSVDGADLDDVLELTIEKCGVGRGVISKSISLFLNSLSIFSTKASPNNGKLKTG